jgi:predicted  nucleic acid-binding Zn-ribbon protein
VHILTKILIVAVALLVVMLVPLVMVNASNEASFRTRYEQARAASVAANASLQAAEIGRLASEGTCQASIQGLEATNAELRRRIQQLESTIRARESETARQAATLAGIQASLEVLRATEQANNRLSRELMTEAQGLRASESDLKRQTVRLEQEISDLRSNNEVLEAARRALQEQLQMVSNEKDLAAATVARYIAYIGALPDASVGVVDAARRPADRSLVATIIDVRRDPDGALPALAEIDAGERDGIREGWTLTVAEGGNFVANLRIVEVDVNRSIGIVELEDPATRGLVRRSQRAIARSGE